LSSHLALGLEARSLWYLAPEKVEIRSELLGPMADGLVRVRALFGALSRGTESLVFRGEVPESQYQRMAAPWMAGNFPYPIKYGYCHVGRIEDGPADRVGQLVFALRPHETMYVADAQDVMPLPAGLPPERAVLSANMETALNAVWDASPGPGDKIVVVGGGVVGCLVAYLCAGLRGAEVTLVDINLERAKVASALGVQFAPPDNAPTECDVVFHCSATATGLATAIGAAGEEAQVLELSWYGKREIYLSLGGAFHSRQIRLQSSQVGHISLTHRPRWTHRKRLQSAMGMLMDERLDVLLTHCVDFEDLPHQLPQLLGTQSPSLCSLIRYL
jgi:NADPH:quinone reductase-like Zn-dependent oxidoreductase